MGVAAPKNPKALAESAQKVCGRSWCATKWGSRLTRGGRVAIGEHALRAHDAATEHSLPYLTLRDITLHRGLVWSTITLKIGDQNQSVTLNGFRHRDAVQAVMAAEQTRIHSNVSALSKLVPAAESIHIQVKKVINRPAWITHSQTERLASIVSEKISQSFPDFPAHAWSTEALAYFSQAHYESLLFIINARDAIPTLIDAHNASFLERELETREVFFDRIEKNPLTEEQRVAAITFDDNVMAIAAAGSGKTSTLVAKAGYAVKASIAEPREILLLAFNSDAAQELRERVDQRLSSEIEHASDIAVSTFHAFGLKVIGEATGTKPRVAPWVDQGNEIEMLGEIVEDLRQDKSFNKDWMLFLTVYARFLPEFGAKEEPEWWDRGSGSFGFQTLRGETVKSKEELMIANWLAINGVEYHYERPYPHATATATYSQYHPDFYYPSADLYHEHFALDQHGHAPEGFVGYEEGTVWKRNVHAEHGTKLIETTSYGIRRADGFDQLDKELRHHGVVFEEAMSTNLSSASPEEEKALLGFMRTFLTHAKSNRLSPDELSRRSDDGVAGARAHAGRENLFLRLFTKIWSSWDRRLSEGGYVDFEDMLVKATKHLADGSYVPSYKIVMADEFQDSSVARGHMLRELTRPAGKRLFVVGDDWQAIYRFAGADISLMNAFADHFGPCSVVPLTKTFRCPQNISDVAARFISKNDAQIYKDVSTTNPRTENSILCLSAKSESGVTGLIESQLSELHERTRHDGATQQSVMILGRYWKDKPAILGNWQSRFGDWLNISFTTVHRSKGLEADYVFLVNVTKGRMGFPSEIEGDPLLLLAMPQGEQYPFAEERRLFYVALTRARQLAVLFTVKGKESEFLIELQKDGEIQIQREDGADAESCPECSKGVLVARRGKFGEFLGCSRFPRCRYTVNINSTALSDRQGRTVKRKHTGT